MNHQNSRFFYVVLFSVVFGLTLSSSVIKAEEPPVPGGICSDLEATYNYTSEVDKTPWVLNELYAVPEGTISPDGWDQSPYFSTQFHNELQSGETSQEFAQACTAVWQNFFSDKAMVIFNIRRTITTTNQLLQCISGNWTYVSMDNLQFSDVSDWLSSGSEPYDITDSNSTLQLQVDLQSLLENLNSQPGAGQETP